jgi:hypothetical protein
MTVRSPRCFARVASADRAGRAFTGVARPAVARTLATAYTHTNVVRGDDRRPVCADCRRFACPTLYGLADIRGERGVRSLNMTPQRISGPLNIEERSGMRTMPVRTGGPSSTQADVR